MLPVGSPQITEVLSVGKPPALVHGVDAKGGTGSRQLSVNWELAGLPRMLNAGESAVTVAEAKRLGFRLMLGCYTMSVVYDAVKRAMEELRDKGAVASVPQRRMEIASLLGLDRVYEMEQEYRASQPASS